MEHTLPLHSNRRAQHLSATQMDLNAGGSPDFVPAQSIDLDSIELSLHPLNFDNQIEIERAKDFLDLLSIEDPDWRAFLPLSDADDHRVFVTEFFRINGEIVGLIAIEMVSLRDDHNSRAAVVSCLLDLEAIEIPMDQVKEYLSNHLGHLSDRQGWRDLTLSSISSFSSLAPFQQW